MKKFVTIIGVVIFAYGFSTAAFAGSPAKCATIQDGNLYTSTGDLIQPGFDQWGYNYQARKFQGGYCDSYHDAAWCQPYKDINLAMKWNSAWLDNKDCNNDGLLDRHYGYPSYIGSGAWLTNNESGTYTDANGNLCSWNYFVKIVAVPVDAIESNGVWYTANGGEIGSVIWGQFAITQVVSNDPCAGDHGVQYHSPVGPGFGKY